MTTVLVVDDCLTDRRRAGGYEFDLLGSEVSDGSD